MQYAYWYIICFIAYLSVRLFGVTDTNLRVIVYGAAIGVIISGLLAKNRINEWGLKDVRKSIEGVNSNFTAYVLAGSIYLWMISWGRHVLTGRWIRWVMISLVLYAAVQIIDLGTRGAIISVIAMACWVLFFPFFPRGGVVPLALSVLLAAVLGSFGVFDSLLLSLDSWYIRSTGDLSGRLDLWPIARSMFDSFYMFAGIGAGAFPEVNPLGIGAHNVFLSIMLDAGLIGLTLFLMFLLLLFRPALSRRASRDSVYLFGLFICFWFPIGLSGVWEVAPFSWLLLAFSFNILRIQRHGQT